MSEKAVAEKEVEIPGGSDESWDVGEGLDNPGFEDVADPDADPEPEILEEITPQLLDEMNNAYNYWHTHGYPEKASVIWECIEQKRRPPANLLPGSLTGIRPETAIDPTSVTMPPRSGPDATHDNWRAFAKRTLDMESEIIDVLDRKDIIKILEDKGVIEKQV